MLRANDHAGAGLMMSRLGEGGKLNKGPMGMGIRLQETMRVGAFKVNEYASYYGFCIVLHRSGCAQTAVVINLYKHVC